MAAVRWDRVEVVTQRERTWCSDDAMIVGSESVKQEKRVGIEKVLRRDSSTWAFSEMPAKQTLKQNGGEFLWSTFPWTPSFIVEGMIFLFFKCQLCIYIELSIASLFLVPQLGFFPRLRKRRYTLSLAWGRGMLILVSDRFEPLVFHLQGEGSITYTNIFSLDLVFSWIEKLK